MASAARKRHLAAVLISLVITAEAIFTDLDIVNPSHSSGFSWRHLSGITPSTRRAAFTAVLATWSDATALSIGLPPPGQITPKSCSSGLTQNASVTAGESPHLPLLPNCPPQAVLSCPSQHDWAVRLRPTGDTSGGILQTVWAITWPTTSCCSCRMPLPPTSRFFETAPCVRLYVARRLAGAREPKRTAGVRQGLAGTTW